MMDMKKTARLLAVDGGTRVFEQNASRRNLFGEREKQAVVALMEKAIIEGSDVLGYNGPEEEAYCKEFADFMGGGFADGVNSGTNAVYIALRALEPEPFSEVIVPAISDPGGVMPVALCNCIPVAADCAPNSYNIGAKQIEPLISERTGAIIVAHIAGIPAEMDAIMKLAEARKIPVVEDCAQAHGATYKGRKIGGWGDVAAFSTMFGKHHATGGQGGVVFTRREDLYWSIRRYADRGKPFGIKDHDGGNVVAALNCNMDEIHAAIGRVQLARLPDMLSARRKVASIVGTACGKLLETVSLIGEPADCESVYWFLLLRLDLSRLTVSKQQFVASLAAEGCPALLNYRPVPVEMDWHVKERAFGRRSRAPWTLNGLDNAPSRRYEFPNLDATDASHFRIYIHECTSEQDAHNIAAALLKVENAYIRKPRKNLTEGN